ncbi:uncharacterized protein LOC123667395 [Melitaea cinxia]|uniref:uncharacterized protein LOC123667395 n=1 Tax=Melitaea cinxia TaxID=113334 RepID=UPI001E2718A2|nr:uncharacterized protein LOC123667395 [Melitaea cinxia]
MPQENHHLIFVATILLLISQLALSATKANARPVYEVVNEQARIDDKPKFTNNPGILPYGNPLAGNSQQNARLHASNQQAMFNAERVRQHKAQLQRWMKGPQIIDSYMKAYHESQENHQLELEEQQATLKNTPVTQPTPRGRPLRQRGQNKRVRNHRSYGSADYRQYVEPKRYQFVYVTPGVSYGQGVNIKPDGNVGFNHLETKESSKLYTQAIPSEAPQTYAKQYSLQKFNSVQEIEALNSLLSKNPTEQLTKFNALIGSDNNNEEINKETPVDFYFYLKDSAQAAPQNIDPTKYTSVYIPSTLNQDYKPITEEIDDIEDPTKNTKPIAFAQSVPPATSTFEPVTTQKNNYYKEEVASQVVSDDATGSHVNYLKENGAAYLNYAYQPYYKTETDAETTERYLHHNAQPTGVQHLAEDGTETSAYGEDDVSINFKVANKKLNKVRTKRSKLETEPFLLPNEKTSVESTTTNSTHAPTSAALIRRNPFNKNRGSDFNVFLTSDFPIGEATDYGDYYEPIKVRKPSKSYESFYEEDDYDNYDDFNSEDYDFGPSNLNSYQTYAPSSSYQKGFTHNFKHFRRRPSLSSFARVHSSPPATSYGVPFYDSSHTFSPPQAYFPPKIEYPTVSSLGSFQTAIEPVYVLTQSQLKDLVGHNNLNIEHLDVYQLLKQNKDKKMYHPRKYRKRNPFRHVKHNLVKLQKFNM